MLYCPIYQPAANTELHDRLQLTNCLFPQQDTHKLKWNRFGLLTSLIFYFLSFILWQILLLLLLLLVSFWLTLVNAADHVLLPFNQQYAIIQSSCPGCSVNSDLSVFFWDFEVETLSISTSVLTLTLFSTISLLLNHTFYIPLAYLMNLANNLILFALCQEYGTLGMIKNFGTLVLLLLIRPFRACINHFACGKLYDYCCSYKPLCS